MAMIAAVRRSTLVEQVLLACCVAFAVAWLLPADFTLRPGEIGDKYAHKRLLLPFMPSPDAATAGELAAIAAAAVPLGFAAVLCGCGADGRRSAASGALVAGFLLATLEAIQVPVFSRTTDASELLAALAGSTLGAGAAALAGRARVVGVDWRAMGLAAAALLWVSAALLCEWWPFQLALDGSRLQYETTAWSRAPFRWPVSAAAVVPGAVLALASGAFVRPRLDPHFARLQTTLVVGFAGAVFAISEVGRVALAGGRTTLLAVAIKLSALAVGLLLGSIAAGERFRGREAQ